MKTLPLLLVATLILFECHASSADAPKDAPREETKPKAALTPAQAAASRKRAAELAKKQQLILQATNTKMSIVGRVARVSAQGLHITALNLAGTDGSPRYVGSCLLVGYTRKLVEGEAVAVVAFPDGIYRESAAGGGVRKFNMVAANVTEPADAETFAVLKGKIAK